MVEPAEHPTTDHRPDGAQDAARGSRAVGSGGGGYAANEGAFNANTASRCHDLHLKIYASMLAGRSAPAIEAAEELVANLPAELLRRFTPPLADTLEGFVPMRLHVMVRFGQWRELTEAPLPTIPHSTASRPR